jgi:hypothetical protein
MAESDFEIRRDEMERDNLQRAIADVETAKGVSSPGTRAVFDIFLQNAKGRVGALEKKIKDAYEARETHEREQAAVVALAQKETALSSREQETYSGFLKEEFFTKKDFGHLEQFYEKTWDRLSEGGKNQMSHRVWEGIRHGEYTFGELPPAVREKEAKRAYGVLSKQSDQAADASRIPEKDRSDFIRAYEAGKQDEAGRVLERESFKNHLSRGAESKEVKSAQVEAGRDGESKAVGERIAAGTAPGAGLQPDHNAGKAKKSFHDLDLDGLKLAEASALPSSADIPRGTPALGKSGQSLGGS